MANVVYFKLEPIPDDENGDWRAVAETSDEFGLIHVVRYGHDRASAFMGLTYPIYKIEGTQRIAWEELSEMEVPY